MSEKTLRSYRAAIRDKWLTIVSRKKFTSHEYKLVDEWFAKGIESGIILRAIKQVEERAKQRSLPLYSLGIISNDIAAIQRDRTRTKVGGKSAVRDPQPATKRDWRTESAENLDEIISETNDPELRAMLNELRRQLPSLTEGQASARLMEILR